MNFLDPIRLLGGAFNKADEFMQKPGGNFLMNLLAQDGYSTMPGSPLGAVGRAGLMTQQQQQLLEAQRQKQAMSEVQKRYLESQIGLNNARASGKLDAGGSTVHSQFVSDGKLGYLGRDGRPVVTDIPVDNSWKIEQLPDGSKIAVNSNNPGQVLPVLSSEDAATMKRDDAINTSETAAQLELPEALANLDKELNSIDSAIGTLENVESKVNFWSTGYPGARLAGIEGSPSYNLRANLKTIQANLAFGQLQKMRAASKTGGALGQVSERELDLLEKAVQALDPNMSDADLRKNIQKVYEHYDNYKREIRVMKEIMKANAGQDDIDLSLLSDEQLEALAGRKK